MYVFQYEPTKLSSSFQGMFIVSLPYGVYHGGYWAILATVGISHICCHTGKILVECLYEPDPEKPGTEDLVKVRYSYKVSTWRKCYYLSFIYVVIG